MDIIDNIEKIGLDTINNIDKLAKAYEISQSFESLEILRKVWVKSQDANKASEGFENLLTKLYPDNAHYILELLQNAEDANKDNDKPSTVTFILTDDKLVFIHNGKKLFDIKDIDSITGLGVSTKVDDKTNIGKFGVGFKSVFAITDEPEIISGKYHFTIQKLFIPKLKKYLPEVNSSESRFIFPFKKNASKTAIEIKNELFGLGSDTLLFLKNINKIEYILSDGKTIGCMAIRIDEEGIYNININIPTQEKKEYYWLRYSDEVGVNIKDENGKTNNYKVLIAFQLEKNDQKESKSKWKIIPSNPGKVCIYFPAEKETSNLLFNIHAPFASTVARDSIRNCEDNNNLRDAISDLISKSLLNIRDRGLLNIDFLEILPIEDDNLSTFYEPIRQKIISAFKEEPLVPTKNGGYAPATTLFKCPKRKHKEDLRIDDVIDENDLSLLTGKEPPLWVKNVLENQREDKFLDSLGIEEWGKNELEAIFNPQNDDVRKSVEEWIRSKSDKWLLELFALFENLDISKNAIDESLKFIKLTDDSYSSISKTLYFLPEDEEDLPDNINFIKRKIFDEYEGKEADKRKKDARCFLEKIGIKRYDENEKTKLRLVKLANKYNDPNHDVSVEESINDIIEFCQYKDSNEILDGKYILLGIDNNFYTADKLCTKIIFDLIEQAELFAEYNKICINDVYKNDLNENQYESFNKLINKLNIMYKLEVVVDDKYFSNGCVRDYRDYRDYTINGIEKIIPILNTERFSIQFSRLIWNAIIEYNNWGVQFKYSEPHGAYKNNFGFKKNDEPSKIVRILSSHAWISDKEGNIRNPKDISYDMLPDDFNINYSSYILKALEFGKNILNKQSELQKRSEAAELLGFNINTFNTLKNAAEKAGVNIDEYINEITQNCSSEIDDDVYDPEKIYEIEQIFPDGGKINIEKINAYIEEIWKKAQPVKREKRFREIRTSYKRSIVRIHLWTHYNGFCQFCFKKSPYWEVAEILLEPTKELEHMNLSLCPCCASEYKKIRLDKEKMDIFIHRLLNADPDNDKYIELDNKNIRFRNIHLVEIKKTLGLERGNE